MISLVTQSLSDSIRVKSELLADQAFWRAFQAMAEESVSVLQSGRKLLLCGNGGSAADAQHIAAELVGRFEKERDGLAALALTVDTSALTAIANDYSFERVFARQVEALGQKGDLLFGLSTSGKSSNVLRALEVAQGKGMKIWAWTGSTSGPIENLCREKCLKVPSQTTARIQEAHITIGHLLCQWIDSQLAKKS
jgi:D-sedoheptulose 7-phosphate isomerase